MKLTFGGSHCESYKNETERCSADDFPPGKNEKKFREIEFTNFFVKSIFSDHGMNEIRFLQIWAA